jgi:hypothetical protein
VQYAKHGAAWIMPLTKTTATLSGVAVAAWAALHQEPLFVLRPLSGSLHEGIGRGGAELSELYRSGGILCCAPEFYAGIKPVAVE